MIAIGGAAMSAIAHILVSAGHRVTGSDAADSPILDRLRAEGCEVWVGHDPAHIVGADLVAISTAVKPGNVELDAAIAADIPVASRPDMMEVLGRLRRTVAVSGTHGKTTTSAMAALVLDAAGWKPSFIVGGQVTQLGTGVRWCESEWLSVEADESDGSFLRFSAEAVIVTNIEADHLDYYGSMDAMERAFDLFVRQAETSRVVCVDDTGCRSMLARLSDLANVTTYGFDPDATYRVVDLQPLKLGASFGVERGGERLASITMNVPGRHNVLNATAVFAMATELGVDPKVTAAALESFTGVGRRFERRGASSGVVFVDDYAHLPTEVAATVQAANSGGWGRVIAVFQPHRFTRVRDVGRDFAHSFDGADVVIVTGLYSAGQAPIAGISGRTVFDAVSETNPTFDLRYCETRPELVSTLVSLLRPEDLCLTMNAGDLTTLPDEMLKHPWALEHRPGIGESGTIDSDSGEAEGSRRNLLGANPLTERQ